MPTLEIVPTVVPAGSGIATITRDTAQEAIAQIPSLVEWFDPSTLYATGTTAASFQMRGKRSGIIARAPNTNRPNASTINGNPALQFGDGGLPQSTTGSGSLLVDDVPLLGTDYTIAFGVNLAATAVGSILGNAIATTYWNINVDSSGRLVVSQQSSAGFVLRPATDYRNSTVVAVLGYLASAQRMTLRVNGGVVATGTTSAAVTSSRLRFGAAGAPGSPTAAGYYMKIGEVLAFNADLTDSSRAAQLLKVETRLRTLYGV